MNRIRVEKEDYYSINNADILDLHINKQGNIDLLVVDTYDFNNAPDSSDLIKLAREHQDRGDFFVSFNFLKIKFAQLANIKELLFVFIIYH